MIKTHLAKRSNWFGGEKLSSLCNRVRTLDVGMNLTDEPAEVTCTFCKKILEAKAKLAKAK